MMPLGLAWSEVTLATRRAVAMPIEQLRLRFRLDGVVQQVGGAQRRTVQALGARHIQIGFVDGGHLHQRREAVEHFVNAAGILAIALRVAVDEDGLRAQLVRGAQRHGGVDAELPRRVGGSGDDAALVGTPADDHGLVLERGIVELFHRDEERVHIDVEDGLHGIMVPPRALRIN